jgi:hypothetical protein
MPDWEQEGRALLGVQVISIESLSRHLSCFQVQRLVTMTHGVRLLAWTSGTSVMV